MVIKMISIVISFLKNKGRLQFLFLKAHFTNLRSSIFFPLIILALVPCGYPALIFQVIDLG